MFAIELRRAVEAASYVKLPELSALLWRAFGAGQVSESEAEELSALIETRKAVQTAAKPKQRYVGSRPRSSASMERRRTWAASGKLPPQIAARFTLAEAAVLSVIAVEVSRNRSCSWPIGQIAAVAGVSETTVKRALREARALGLLAIEERRLTRWRNATNVVRIASSDWAAWLRLQGGGGQSAPGTRSKIQTRVQNEIAMAKSYRKEVGTKGSFVSSEDEFVRNVCSSPAVNCKFS